MSGKMSSAVEKAVADVQAGRETVSGAARKHECNVSSVRRALRRAGVPPLGQPMKGKRKPLADARPVQYHYADGTPLT